jgi:hypothetical protein
MSWTKVTFGRHEGKTLPEIALNDPDYFFGEIEKDTFNNGQLANEARKINYRARNIKIPQKNGLGKRVAVYTIDYSTRRFGRMHIVPASDNKYRGSLRKDTIDLSVPRGISKYDKQGYERMIKEIKKTIFENENIELTKNISEDFFDDDSNFVMK